VERSVLKTTHRAITPYSAATTGADVPALKHFFRCLETSGTTLTDQIGGCQIDLTGINAVPAEELVPAIPAEFYYDLTGTVPSVATNYQGTANGIPIALSKGQWHTFTESKDLLIVCSGRVVQSSAGGTITDPYVRVALGDTNAMVTADTVHTGLGISSSPTFHTYLGHHSGEGNAARMAVNAAAPLQVYPSGATLPIGKSIGDPILNVETTYYNQADITFVLTKVAGQNPTLIAYITDSWVGQIDTPSMTVDTLVGTSEQWQPSPYMRFANIALYGYAVFEFEAGLPSDYAFASMWMGQEWKRSNRVIWPQWVGVT